MLGINGSGKSTLLRIMAGLDKEFDGEARPQAGIKIGYLPQEPELDLEKNVRQNVETGVSEIQSLLTRFDEISMRFGEELSEDEMNTLLEEQGKLQDAIDSCGGWELDRKLDIAADALRLPPWDSKVTNLSGGEKRRVEIVRALVTNPEFILLDEPFAGIDPIAVHEIQQIIKTLKEKGLGVVISDHNVRETLAITDRSYLIHAGKLILTGTSSEIVKNPLAKKFYLGDDFSL